MTRANRNPLNQRTLLGVFCAVAWAALSASSAQAVVDAQLNLRYYNPADESAGGTWDLLVKSSAENGVAGILVRLAGDTGVTGVDTPSDAIIPNSDVFDNVSDVFRYQRLNSGLTEFVSGDILEDPVLLGVGTGAGSPGNIPQDDLFPNGAGNNPWDNSALIASGTFAGSRLTLSTVEANEFTAESTAVAATIGTFVVRGDAAIDGSGFEEMLLGDVDRSGKIDNNDFNVVINHFQTSGNTWDSGDIDGTSTGQVDNADLNTVLGNFYQSAANPPLLATASATGSSATGSSAPGSSVLESSVLESPAMLAAAGLNSFALTAEVGAAFDLNSTPVAMPDISQDVGEPLIYRIDFKVETSDLDAGELGFANVGFNLVSDNLTDNSPTWDPNTDVAATPDGSKPLFAINQDAGAVGDLQGILASIAGNLVDPNDPRTQVGQGGPTTIGSVFVQWDGVTPGSISTDNVLFSANSAGGQFLPAFSGATASIQFGAVPEPTAFALAGLALIGFAVRRRQN